MSIIALQSKGGIMKKVALLLTCIALISLNGCGSSSSAISAPENVTVENGGAGFLTISWDEVTAATSYNIYWSETEGVTKAGVVDGLIKEVGTKIEDVTTPYTHTGRVAGTTYYYPEQLTII